MKPPPTPPPATLAVHGLRVERAGRMLAQLARLEVHAGEFVALIGPNGAGKSSLFRAFTGEWPASGHIGLWGRPLPHWPRVELARRMAVMPQHSHLHFDFTVNEVISLGRLPHRGEPLRQTREAVQACMRALELEPFAGRRFTTLSGGERQRVQFARVMAQLWGTPDPTLLLLDEPTSALDLAQQQSVLDQAWRLSRAGTTVVAVMHDLNMAARYADRLVALQQGQLVFDGAPTDFLAQDRLAAVFGVQAQVECSASDGLPVVLLGPRR